MIKLNTLFINLRHCTFVGLAALSLQAWAQSPGIGAEVAPVTPSSIGLPEVSPSQLIKPQPGGPAPGESTIRVPEGTRMVIFILDRGLFVTGPNGKPSETCTLCSPVLAERYGPHCDRAPRGGNICAALTRATVNEIQNLVILTTHKNPDCTGVSLGGVKAFVEPPGCLHP